MRGACRMDYTIFNEDVRHIANQEKDSLSPRVLSYLLESEVQEIEEGDAFEGEGSPSDYWVNSVYKEKSVTISFMYQCEPNSEELDFTDDELYKIFEIYCDAGMKDFDC